MVVLPCLPSLLSMQRIYVEAFFFAMYIIIGTPDLALPRHPCFMLYRRTPLPALTPTHRDRLDQSKITARNRGPQVRRPAVQPVGGHGLGLRGRGRLRRVLQAHVQPWRGAVAVQAQDGRRRRVGRCRPADEPAHRDRALPRRPRVQGDFHFLS